MSLPSGQIQYQLAHIHEDRASEIVISHAVLLPLAVIAVVARFIARRLCRAHIGLDDYMIVVALLAAIGEATGALLCVANGGAKHAVTVKDPIKLNKLILVTEAFYIPGVTAVKLSALLLYRRIFPSKNFRRILWIVGGAIICYTIPQPPILIFQCVPISGAWDPAVHIRAKCVPLNDIFTAFGSLNVVTDIITLSLPLPLIWRLQINKVQKFQLFGTFLLGYFVCVVSIIRVLKIKQLSPTDPGWTDVDPCVWSLVEVCVAIVCACLPTFRVLFNRLILQKRVGSSAYLVDMPRYPSSTTNERQADFRSKDSAAQVEVANVVPNNWVQVPACE
ncbi:hypothetical protein JMJ35_006131 [Cladonia borealis]|uniref:Rhodopsin domain-containing protein n=1 Tax=Cladonia borealis TaxID=184061 RepID=A0AA39V0V6_9LECA|nr:hypothetical protein JMJ35_006131 [Cladonia borealis]